MVIRVVKDGGALIVGGGGLGKGGGCKNSSGNAIEMVGTVVVVVSTGWQGLIVWHGKIMKFHLQFLCGTEFVEIKIRCVMCNQGHYRSHEIVGASKTRKFQFLGCLKISCSKTDLVDLDPKYLSLRAKELLERQTSMKEVAKTKKKETTATSNQIE